METRPFHGDNISQQNTMPISYVPIASAPSQYIIATNGQEYYVTPEAPHSNWNMHMRYQGYPGSQQCFVMVPDILQSGAMLTDNSGNGHQKVAQCNYVPVSQWTHIPDVRLNPNSQEFYQKSQPVQYQQKIESSKSDQYQEIRYVSSEGESISGSSIHTRSNSTDSSENGLSSKLDKLNLRYQSGDSGIAETSSSSATWSSDDDVDNITSQRITSQRLQTSPEEIQERLWNIWDDERYWRNVRRPPPDNVLCCVIAKQIEFYMSDSYLAKDKYLLRQIRCKKDGYVSIKLMTSFKKMKKLAQDWPVLRSAIVRISRTLVVSGEGMRIRRKVQLSEELRKPRMLTSILAIRLPDTYNAVDKITSLFRVFGEIGLVRLLRPDKAVPVDLRNYATQVPDIGVSLCAVVDFESPIDALGAVRVLKTRSRELAGEENDQNEIENQGNIYKESELSEEDGERLRKIVEEMPDLANMRLALLGPRVRRTLYRQDRNNNPANIETRMKFPSHNNDIFTRRTAENMSSFTNGYERNSNTLSWRNSRPASASPTKHNNVLRQPKGAQDDGGFIYRRNISK
uniref:uncharacterized protein LOC120329787 isoform X1 n=1 Tax=Styela clava TaxID=7725 RepID=UPI0019395530|nr:uncharacterized protein LOC120329787 isoform X1 [Styela clava]